MYIEIKGFYCMYSESFYFYPGQNLHDLIGINISIWATAHLPLP